MLGFTRLFEEFCGIACWSISAAIVGILHSLIFTLFTVRQINYEWVTTFWAYEVIFLGLFIGSISRLVLKLVLKTKNQDYNQKNKIITTIVSSLIGIISAIIIETIPVFNFIITKSYITDAWIAPAWETSHAVILGGIISLITGTLDLELKLKTVIQASLYTTTTVLILTFIGMAFTGFFLSQGESLKWWWIINSIIVGLTIWINSNFLHKKLDDPKN